jgi:hypothetical protein
MTGNIFLNTQNIRANTIPKREIVSSESAQAPAETADDFYKVTQVSYDKDLLDKGITSAAPVTLAVIPFKKLKEVDNAESNILNIQRNLNTITISNVNDIINELTGSEFSSNELIALNDNTQFDAFKQAVNKISAAYNAKSAYMTHLANMYLSETDENYSYDYGTGDYPQKLNAVGIAQSETKLAWIESELKVVKSGYNIAQLMQILRNSFARRKFGKNFTSIVLRDTPMSVMPANLSYYSQIYDEFFTPVYASRDRTTGRYAPITDIDNKLDMLIIADAKDVTYTANNINPNEYYARIIGQLSNFDEKIQLSNTTNAGSFSNLLKYTDESYTVLPVDVSVGNQDDLKLYRSADEFFIGQPLITDKNSLKTRAQKFSNDAIIIENSFKEDVAKLAGINTSTGDIKDLGSWRSFLVQMNAMMLDSFYTTNSWTSIIRFSILLKAIEDTRAKSVIFKIMMLRDRVKNHKKYSATVTQENAFLTAARSELEDAVTELVSIFSPSEAQIENSDDADQLSFDTFRAALGQATPSFTNQLFEWDSRQSASTIVAGVVEGLIDPSSHQWDNFFLAATSAENIATTSSPKFKTDKAWTPGSSVLQSKIGISTGFLNLSRDDRSFLFLSKWLSIIVDFPFSITVEARTSNSGNTGGNNKQEFGTSSTEPLIKFKAFYSTTAYEDLRKSLTLTFDDNADADSFGNFIKYSWPISQSIIQDGQDFYDGVNFVYRFIMQSSSLLTIATNLAFDYAPTFNENLSNNYTYNAVLNLNRQARFAFSKNDTYKNFSKDQHKSTNTLNGFLKYIQDDDEVSEIEDSFVVVCGMPYGILDRLGAFDQTKIAYLNLSLTIRTINSLTTDDVIITKQYPIQGIIEQQLLNFSPETNVSHDMILNATTLYELNKNRTFVTNTQFSSESKKNELQSTSLLNYLQLFYGIDFNPYLTVQKTLPPITGQGVLSAREKVKEKVYKYRFGELIESRYASTGVNSLATTKGDLITKALGGNIFDKIVAIPVDANLLTGESNGYLVDIIASVTTEFVTRSVVDTTRSTVKDVIRGQGPLVNILDAASGLSQSSISSIVNNTL